jgi:alpha-D-xyloside xylohydrolase
MKFTDGQWMLQPGVAAHYAAEAYAVEAHADRLVVLATTRPIKQRGDTLQGPTLTVTLTSPLPGVIRVSVEHYTASTRRACTSPWWAPPTPPCRSARPTPTPR